MRSRLFKIAVAAGASLLLVVIVAGLWARSTIRGSLPLLDGEAELSVLADEVAVARDALGVPLVQASTRRDALAALGFLHAQERFFQMDLLRRAAAGTLSELLGDAPLDYDARIRRNRFSEFARRANSEKRLRRILAS